MREFLAVLRARVEEDECHQVYYRLGPVVRRPVRSGLFIALCLRDRLQGYVPNWIHLNNEQVVSNDWKYVVL